MMLQVMKAAEKPWGALEALSGPEKVNPHPEAVVHREAVDLQP
jgi:hypothetical protein